MTTRVPSDCSSPGTAGAVAGGSCANLHAGHPEGGSRANLHAGHPEGGKKVPKSQANLHAGHPEGGKKVPKSQARGFSKQALNTSGDPKMLESREMRAARSPVLVLELRSRVVPGRTPKTAVRRTGRLKPPNQNQNQWQVRIHAASPGPQPERDPQTRATFTKHTVNKSVCQFVPRQHLQSQVAAANLCVCCPGHMYRAVFERG